MVRSCGGLVAERVKHLVPLIEAQPGAWLEFAHEAQPSSRFGRQIGLGQALPLAALLHQRS